MVAFPQAHFVLDAKGKPKLVAEDEEVKGEEIEMVDNEEQGNEIVKLLVVNCPLDDLCYSYLDFCVDHLFHNPDNKEI